MRTATIERETLSTPVMLAVIAHASKVIGGGADTSARASSDAPFTREEPNMEYKQPGFACSDSGDTPRRITATIYVATSGVTREEAA